MNLRLQNEIQFKRRAEKILKHHHQHDQIRIENKIINELQQKLYIIKSDLENEINKESELSGIICMY